MLLKQKFETLTNVRGVANCDMESMVEQSRVMCRGWNDFLVNNEKGANFSIDENMKFNYLTQSGDCRSADISEFAFSQLCTRLGVPANYVKKCFEKGKVNLALDNFRAWAGECDKNILVREHEGVARAVLSDSYVPFDSFKVIKTLKYTVNTSKYKLSQVHLSEDKLHMRFVDYTPINVNDGSPLYAGFTVSSSDVGLASLSCRFFLYRAACQNGLVISSMGGTLFRQSHVGAKMSDSKISMFNRAFMNIDKLTAQAELLIKANRNTYLKDFELEMYLAKAKSELKLSEKSMDKLKTLIGGKYEQNKWGIINGITELAQDFTLETRVDMESWAGELLINTKAA